MKSLQLFKFVAGGMVLAVYMSCVLALQCTHGEIRLARNSTPLEGGIDVCVNNSGWGTVCNDFWGSNEIRVVCRQLGFGVSGRERFIDLLIEGGPDIIIDNINCTGNEQSLVDCSFSSEVSDCLGDITHKVGVRCHEERPPQNVAVISLVSALNVTWEEPLFGITNDPVAGYNVDCTTSSNGIIYGARGSVDSTTTFILIVLDNPVSETFVSYNCCVEVEYETYSSIACASGRHAPSPSTTTVGEVSSNDQQAAARIQTTAIGGVLGAIIVILTSLLVLSLLGMLYLYIRMKTTEEVFTTRKRTLSSSSDAVEHVVDNPTYGENESIAVYDGVEQYNRTGPDYEPFDGGHNNIEEGYASMVMEDVHDGERDFDQTSAHSVQI